MLSVTYFLVLPSSRPCHYDCYGVPTVRPICSAITGHISHYPPGPVFSVERLPISYTSRCSRRFWTFKRLFGGGLYRRWSCPVPDDFKVQSAKRATHVPRIPHFRELFAKCDSYRWFIQHPFSYWLPGNALSPTVAGRSIPSTSPLHCCYLPIASTADSSASVISSPKITHRRKYNTWSLRHPANVSHAL